SERSIAPTVVSVSRWTVWQRRTWTGLLLLAGVTTVFGLLAPYQRNAIAPSAKFPAAAWWLCKIERNRFLRAPVGGGDWINCIFSVEDGRLLWVAGNNG